MLLDEPTEPPIEYHGALEILLPVALMSLPIFKDVLNHGHPNHESQRHQHHWLASRDRDNIDHLHEGDQQEVHIGHF